ncbi:MAG: coproporphyrinogen dehydrogenase HemZ [Acutalibacteraceae bacterium]|nr:coproporphyrinogen dehydrogenase HemZ [Acutalibacteraceae bacterium]
MIRLNLVGNDYKYELENIIRLFYPEQQVSPDTGDFMYITAKIRENELSVLVKCERGSYYKDEVCNDKNDRERTLCFLLYQILSQLTGIHAGWGIQTGVRPVKLLRNLTDKSGEAAAHKYFTEKMLVSDEKYRLAKTVLDVQAPILDEITPKSFSLYIGIPFCKSRCSYCSFVSHDITKSVKLIPDYIRLLCKEIEYTAKIAKDLGLTLQTVYIGGGTPTAVSAEQLVAVMDTVNRSFDMTGVREFTVEAGRPDTIDAEKLAAIKSGGADRISINPQTLNDDVLRTIRRNHTAEQFYEAYNLAVAAGFENINTDLIAGLPTDTLESFTNTINDIIALYPSAITVHTLSVKRSSRMVYKNQAVYDAKGEAVSDMLGVSNAALLSNGYIPYYMYRQSRMAGNNENIGWSLPERYSRYNIFIMEEMQTILACGGGASTKLVGDHGNIKRIFNYKYPYEYIGGFDEILSRKKAIYDFYGS